MFSESTLTQMTHLLATFGPLFWFCSGHIDCFGSLLSPKDALTSSEKPSIITFLARNNRELACGW